MNSCGHKTTCQLEQIQMIDNGSCGVNCHNRWSNTSERGEKQCKRNVAPTFYNDICKTIKSLYNYRRDILLTNFAS